MEEEHLSYCRICAAACGIVVTVDSQRVLRVRGDADHPVSRGYTCSKGRGLPQWHHAPGRLDRPRVRGRGVSWDDALGDLADVATANKDAHGPDSVGLYLATGLAYDAAGQVAAGRWLRSIGSAALYSAATVDNAPALVAAELVAGNAMLNPVWDPSAPGLLVLVGTNPVVSHGYGTSLPDPVRHLRDYRTGGGRVWVIDPRRTETAALADEHLAVRPGADVAVLAALVSALLDDGADRAELCTGEDLDALRIAVAPFTVERAAAAAGVDGRALVRLIAELREHPGRLAVMCGTGTTMSTDGILVEWLRWVLLVLSGSLDRPGGMRFNRGAINRLRPPRDGSPATLPGPSSRPELPRVAGQLPAVALADEIEAGALRVLVVIGGNPITAFPDPDRMRAALGRLDALVVVDVMESELTDIATHVLPATGQLERSDLSIAELTAVRSGLQATSAVVAPAGERRPVWWMLASLARRMGGDLLAGADPDAMTDDVFLAGLLARSPLEPAAVFAAGSRGVDVADERGWVRDTMLTDGRWQIAPAVLLERLASWCDPEPALVLAPRREMAWSNSIRYAGEGREPVVRMHPDDAAEVGVADRAEANVTSAHGSITAVVAHDPNVRRGVVSITHGRLDGSPGRLTSVRVGVDPLTTMPQASGVPVTVTPSPDADT
ncbi:MAG: molybdopterin-containing oxidoreductase family protein [Acidimicrobiia bacterium]